MMFSYRTRHIAAMALLAFTSQATYAATALKTDKQKYSYAIGVKVANNLKSQGIELDPQSLSAAISDVLSGKKLQASEKELNTALNTLLQKNKAKKDAKAQAALEAGKKFLAANKKKKGVISLPNGMQYKIIKSAKGKKPKSSDTIVASYEGKLLNGKVFDSSYKRGSPATFPVNAVIKGWQKIIPMMPVGSTWEVVIPPELAYGSHGAGRDIGPNETLIFKIELVSIKS